MKKFMMVIAFVMVFALIGCGSILGDKEAKKSKGDEGNEPTEEQAQSENEDSDVDGADTEEEGAGEGEETNADAETGNLTVQLLVPDEEDGITLEDNEIYQAVQAQVDSDPDLGIPNDFSVYPFDIVYFEDGSYTIMFLGINRVDKPIKNMAFDVTLGNKDGDYIFDNTNVDLPEELIGTLKPNSVIPFFVDIDEADEELFNSLDENNTELGIDNFKVDFVE